VAQYRNTCIDEALDQIKHYAELYGPLFPAPRTLFGKQEYNVTVLCKNGCFALPSRNHIYDYRRAGLRSEQETASPTFMIASNPRRSGDSRPSTAPTTGRRSRLLQQQSMTRLQWCNHIQIINNLQCGNLQPQPALPPATATSAAPNHPKSPTSLVPPLAPH
jgi:hypothetical protein